MQHLAPGTILSGQYRIVRFIAQGGFGCTYEAEHILLENHPTVAIKEFFPKTLCDRQPGTNHMSVPSVGNVDMVDKLRKKFIAEANALSALSHPGIVRVVTVFLENDTAYFVMDFIKGESLGSIIKKKGALPCDVAVNYIREVAETLGYVHDKGRLHLDIKPDNILINENGRTVLIDFGVSKQAKDDGGMTSTITGYSVGFAPPEQMLRRIDVLGRPSDIYALGATLYCLIIGHHPNADELIVYPDNVPQPVRDAIDACLQPIVKKRPQNIAEFLAILDGKAKTAAAAAAPQKTAAPENKAAVDDGTVIDGKNDVKTSEKPEGAKATNTTADKQRRTASAIAGTAIVPDEPVGSSRNKLTVAIIAVAVVLTVVLGIIFGKNLASDQPSETATDTVITEMEKNIGTSTATPVNTTTTPTPVQTDNSPTPASDSPKKTSTTKTTTQPKPITTVPAKTTTQSSTTNTSSSSSKTSSSSSQTQTTAKPSSSTTDTPPTSRGRD